MFGKLGTIIRKITMKNERKKGKSAKRGNSPAPYTKRHKKPFPYGAEYKMNCIHKGVCCRRRTDENGVRYVPIYVEDARAREQEASKAA